MKPIFIKFLSIIIIFLSIVSCGPKENKKYIYTDGILVINGLENYIDAYIVAEAKLDEYNLYAAKNTFIDLGSELYGVSFAKITENSIKLKLYKEEEIWTGNTGHPIFHSYNGNHEYIEFTIVSMYSYPVRGTVTVSFNEGVGEGEFIPDEEKPNYDDGVTRILP